MSDQNQTAAALAFTGLAVIGIQSFLHTHQREIRLSPITDAALTDTRTDLVIVTSDPELHKALTLGRTFGEYSQPLDLAASGEDLIDIDASAASAIAGVFKNIGTGLAKVVGYTVTPTEKNAAEEAVIAFVGKDGLQLAEDAVVYVNTHLPGQSGTAARDAAITKLKADAATAKKDLSHLASAAFNFVIEAALQIALSKGTVVLANAAAAITAKA